MQLQWALCMAVDRRLQAGQVSRRTEAPKMKLTCLHLLQLAAAPSPVCQPLLLLVRQCQQNLVRLP